MGVIRILAINYRGYDIYHTDRGCPYWAVDIYTAGADTSMASPRAKLCQDHPWLEWAQVKPQVDAWIDSFSVLPGTEVGAHMIINTQTNLKGTVEKRSGDMLWHITSPAVKDISYGGPDATPATWIDENGNEQMAVIKMKGWGINDIALDNNLSGGYGEKYVPYSAVDIISEKAGYTTQLRYPALLSKTSNTVLIIAAAMALGAMFYLMTGKK